MAQAAYPAHVGHILIAALKRYKSDNVMQAGGGTVTGADMLRRTSQYVQALEAAGVGPFSTIAILAKNVPEVLYVMGVGWVRGVCRVALHPLASLDDHVFVLTDCGATTVIIDPSFAEHAQALVARIPKLQVLTIGPASLGTDLNALADGYPPAPIEITPYGEDQVLSYGYTGGTTGTPKGVVVNARVITEMTKIQLAEWEWPAQGRFLFCTPLSHAGASFFLPMLLTGGTSIVLPTFDPSAVLRAIEQERINVTFLVPSMIYAILDHPDSHTRDLTSLETVYYGASPMNPSRLAEGLERFGPIFAQVYGQSEAPMVVTYFSRADHLGPASRLTSCGRPSPFVMSALLGSDGGTVPVGEPGEICVAGGLLAAGYHNRPEVTAETFRESGWLHTGDIAREDDDGFWHIVDRTKDMIVTGGFNVYPREVEDIIAADPAVARVAVIGTPDDKWGEAVTALVILRDGFVLDDATAERMTHAVRDSKGPVQAPKRIIEVQSIPVTALGKPDKKTLRAQFWAGERVVG
ncbi:fatty-acyl-CoA synthase [Jatrophihabitans sp. GAS493]|uniref:AMP-binding protein n=1 Tax=Jatrophihabitans sp. GAS493 TaxID=1907575 RepID=UPI000BB93100|nr:AMP-binding protein [Jatrophihabitans sp. GAS493]SOD74064.1 fatty-acyl-CoA synthase [Jatrophihabitans sp. GAS493]